MKSVEEWYSQWSNNPKEMTKNINEANKQKIKILKLEILNNKDKYINSMYKKYARSQTKSVVDNSFIYDKVIDGVSSIRLINKEPKNNNVNYIYEYGFDNQNKCLFRKIKNNNMDKIDRLYLYYEDHIYEVGVLNIQENDLTTMNISILGEYYFDEQGNPIEIIRHYGILNYERYNWISHNIAMINCNTKHYILIRDNCDVFAIFQRIYRKNNSQLFSYRTQNYISLNENISLEEKLSFDEICINYCTIKDVQDKPTEYKIIDIYGKNYLVSTEYIRVSKNFSYKNAKKAYQDELLEFVKKQIKIIDFKVKYINIQYFNYGYSIMDIIIGFDEIYCEDINSMKVQEDLVFSDRNRNLIIDMNNYINEKMYFNAFKRMMKLLKNHIEKEYDVKVLLIEISD